MLQDLNLQTELESVDGRHKFPALIIFSHAIRYLGQHLLDLLNLESGCDIDAKQIKWVLTVPAIWKDKAKQFMREAFKEVTLQIWKTCWSVCLLS